MFGKEAYFEVLIMLGDWRRGKLVGGGWDG